MTKVIILAGKAGSGKDTLKRLLVQYMEQDGMQINNIITSTTRDKRANEVDGVDYYFYTSEQMTEKLLNDELAEAVVFNGWVYATEYKALSKDKINIGIYNLAGAEALAQNPELETYIIYLDVEDSVRLIRYLDRDEMTKDKIREMFRRYEADEQDFEDVEDIATHIFKPDVKASPEENAKELLSLVKEILK